MGTAELELSFVATTLRKRAVLIAVLTVAFAVAGFAFQRLAKPVYEASVSIRNGTVAVSGAPLLALSSADAKIVLEGPEARRRAARDAGLSDSVADSCSVAVAPANDALFTLSVRSTSEGAAMRLCEALTTYYFEQGRREIARVQRPLRDAVTTIDREISTLRSEIEGLASEGGRPRTGDAWASYLEQRMSDLERTRVDYQVRLALSRDFTTASAVSVRAVRRFSPVSAATAAGLAGLALSAYLVVLVELARRGAHSGQAA